MQYINLNKLNGPIFLRENTMDTKNEKYKTKNSKNNITKQTSKEDEINRIKDELFSSRKDLTQYCAEKDLYGNVQKEIRKALKESSLPAVCFEDLVIKTPSESLYIDYLIVTSTCAYVLEVKSLIGGDIAISPNGDFYKCTKGSNSLKQERIVNPLISGDKKSFALECLLKDRLGLKIDPSYPILHMAVSSGRRNVSNAPKEMQKKLYTLKSFIDTIDNMRYNYEYSQLSNVEMLTLLLEIMKMDVKTKQVDKRIVDTLYILNSEVDSEISEIKDEVRAIADKYAFNNGVNIEGVITECELHVLTILRPKTIFQLMWGIDNKDFVRSHFEELLNVFKRSKLRLEPLKTRNTREKLESFKRYASGIVGFDTEEILRESDIDILLNSESACADTVSKLKTFRDPAIKNSFLDDIAYILATCKN